MTPITAPAPQSRRAEANRGAHFTAKGCRRHRAMGGPALVLVSALVTVLSWRHAPWGPVVANIDSWQAGLALGFQHHLQWGPQLVFTYGPYGFAESILPLSRATAALGFAYGLGVTWGTATLVVASLRPSWGLVPAALGAWVALGIAATTLEAPELALATALGLALASLRADGHRARCAWLATLGALAGFQLLVEINVGLVTTALLALAVAGRSWETGGRAGEDGARRGRAASGDVVLAGGVPFVSVPVIALAAAGQSLGNIPAYLHGSLEVALGYSSAMSSSSGRVPEDWFAVVDLAVVAVFFGLALRGRPAREKAAVGLMLTGWAWEVLKEGFVRHDTHDTTFFGLMVLALCLARLPRALGAYQAGAIALGTVVACIAAGGAPVSPGTPFQAVSALAHEVRDLALPSQFAKRQFYARRQARSTGDALPGPLLQSLAGHTVAGATIEDALSFAYPQLDWDPLPVLQSYSAYTTYLDDLDASFLTSPAAPQRILYRPLTIDNRDPWWDPPATTEAMYCHYSQIGVSGPWQVLARIPDRCGPATVISRASTRFGHPIEVPRAAAGDMVVAEFSVSSPLVAGLAGFLLKPPEVHVSTWVGNSPSPTTYRFILGTARNAHVVSVPPALGYSTPFSPPALDRLQFSGDGWAPGDGVVDITFLAVPVSR